MSVVNTGKPDLAVGLVKLRDASERPAEEVGMVAHVVEVIATIVNVGEVLALETTTRFWVEGADINRELRIVHSPELPPGEEIEVTALWDVRQRHGAYAITRDGRRVLPDQRDSRGQQLGDCTRHRSRYAGRAGIASGFHFTTAVP
jgi:hypothetical protein